MSDIEPFQEKTLIDKLKDVEDAGLLHIKGYTYHEISSLMSITVNETKELINEYKKILTRQADEDPYFLERLQFNTIKALQEFDQISKEAWETVSIATDHGMIAARLQALKLASDVATKKAQLHKLMGSAQADSDYIARMQRAENVNQILSKILRDVISKHPDIADQVRRELAVAFEIMQDEEQQSEVEFIEADVKEP
jgi:cysteinyl-tRNA synthetase